MLDSAKEVLNKYVTDMVGVIKHIHEAVERQLQDDDTHKFPEARVLLTSLASELNSQRSHLDGLATEINAQHLSAAKEALTAATGFMAGIYDHLRHHPVSKDLRDDYVAVTMACVAYEMLHTTGLAVQHRETADLALRHLRQLTPYVTQIGQLIAQIVMKELGDKGVAVDTSAAEIAARNNREAWGLGGSARSV